MQTKSELLVQIDKLKDKLASEQIVSLNRLLEIKRLGGDPHDLRDPDEKLREARSATLQAEMERDKAQARIAELEEALADAGRQMSSILERMETEHLRDQFAGQALAGMMANVALAYTADPKTCAHDAYEFADAMLEARKEKGND